MKDIQSMAEQHLWVCEYIKGADGEIQIKTPLTEEQIQTLEADPNMAEQFCPDGDIICSNCGITFTGNPRKHTSRRSIEEIERSLD